MNRSLIPLMMDHTPSTFDEFFDLFGHPSFTPYMMARNYFPRFPHFSNNSTFGGEVCTEESGNFNVKIDMKDFQPEEIIVKIIGDNVISIEGKHEEKQDQHGSIYRHFVRKFSVPGGFDVKNVTSKMSTDRQLVVSVPKTSDGHATERIIQIQQTGQRAVKEKCEKGAECTK